MLTIRLSRVGTTKRPFYRVVVVESSAPRDGRFVERLGHYNPCAEPEVLEVDRERVSHWIANGASPSDTVRTLLARHPAPVPAEAPVEPEAPAVVEAATPAESADETQAAT
jgi:small subunit ribosomal protein S16